MDDTITTIYCLSEEFLQAMGHRDDPQVRLSSAEVMTIPLVAAAFFGGNIEKARSFLSEYGYMKSMISTDYGPGHPERNYVVDSLPLPVCDNIRIRRCRIYPLKEHGENVPRLYPEQTSVLLRPQGASCGDASCGEWLGGAGGVFAGSWIGGGCERVQGSLFGSR